MRLFAISAAVLLVLTGFAHAQEMTATCNDGTSWSGTRRSGACSGHQGVKMFGTPAATSPQATPASPVPQTSLGGAKQVWLNTASKVYHCPGDRDYGHTKAGQYMTEEAAKSAGGRPSRGKVCS